MARIESALLVHKRPEEVFAFLSKCESHRKFIPRMAELKQTSPGTFGQTGTQLSGVLHYFGIPIPVQYEIIEVMQDRQLAMKGQMGPILFQDGYILERHGEGTEIRFWLDLLPRGWTKLLFPFTGLIGRIHAWETLRNLKRELAVEEIARSGRTPSAQ